VKIHTTTRDIDLDPATDGALTQKQLDDMDTIYFTAALVEASGAAGADHQCLTAWVRIAQHLRAKGYKRVTA
jgi:hypothetical protein